MHVIYATKDEKPRRIQDIGDDVLEVFLDTPVCPLCGKKMSSSLINYLGMWFIQDSSKEDRINIICAYRLCTSCYNLINSNINMKNSPKVWVQIENTLKLYYPNLKYTYIEAVGGTIPDGKKLDLLN